MLAKEQAERMDRPVDTPLARRQPAAPPLNEPIRPRLLDAAVAFLACEVGEGAQSVSGQRGTSAEAGACGADGALLRFARSQGAVSPEAWLELLSPLEGGNEHEIYQDPGQPDLLYKVTEPGLRLRNGRDRIPKVTELHYLVRWQLANLAFGDSADLVGVIPTVEGLRIVIQQPFVPSVEETVPNPEQRAINRWLYAAGFEYQSGAWVRREDGLVMVDTHEGNFVHSPHGLRPVDVELYRLPKSSGDVIPWEMTRHHLLAAGMQA